jgi:hypothetical protein
MAGVGDRLILNGTKNIFEITGEVNDYWIIKIITKESVEIDVLMNKLDLRESVNDKLLIEE